MSRAFRLTAFVLLLASVVAACGSRVVPLEVGAIGPGGQPLANPTANPTSTTGLQPTIGPSGGSVGPNPIQTLNATCKPGAAPTDTGVTKDTIKIAMITSRGGSLPGQFIAAEQAVDTYFRMINAEGGICNRGIQLLIYDDNGNGGQDLAWANRAAEEDKVFAFVGSVSAPDDSGIAKVSKEHKIPDVGFPLTYARAENPYSYGVPGQLQRDITGEGCGGCRYLNNLLGVKQIAEFWLEDSLVSKSNAWAFEAAAIKASGVKVCHEQPTGIVDQNFATYVSKMQSNCRSSGGPVAVYTTMENNSNIRLARAMDEAGFKPALFLPTFTSYLPSFIDQGGSSVEGTYIALPHIPFERCARDSRGRPIPPCSHPELNRYISALQQFKPNYDAPGSWGAPGWGMADLFTQAATKCGANLTRTCLFKQLDAMGPYSANGFLTPTRPSDHLIYSADLVLQVRNGRFVEIQANNKNGPPGAPDFWDVSKLFNWWDYYCDNKGKFINTDEKDQFIEC